MPCCSLANTVGRRIDDPPTACKYAEKAMVNNAEAVQLKSAVIIAPHHGADNASAHCFIQTAAPQQKPPRPGSKQARLITMLMQPGGRSIDELSQALGWQIHTTRAVISRLGKGEDVVVRAKIEAGVSAYRIESAAGLSSSASRRLYAVR